MKKILALAILASGFWLLTPALRAAETVPQTQTVLKSYFTTGNVPTQTNYWELIDTMFWYVNAIYTNSQTASSNAALAVALSPSLGTFQLTANNSFPQAAIAHTNNIASLGYSYGNNSGALFWHITNYFSNPMVNTAYIPVLTSGNNLAANVAIVQFTNCIVFNLTNLANGYSGPNSAFYILYR